MEIYNRKAKECFQIMAEAMKSNNIRKAILFMKRKKSYLQKNIISNQTIMMLEQSKIAIEAGEVQSEEEYKHEHRQHEELEDLEDFPTHTPCPITSEELPIEEFFKPIPITTEEENELMMELKDISFEKKIEEPRKVVIEPEINLDDLMLN